MNLRGDTTAPAAVPATRSARNSIEDAFERLLALLDQMDGDPDFEEQHDAEPEEADQNGDEGDFDGGEHDLPGHIPGGQGL